METRPWRYSDKAGHFAGRIDKMGEFSVKATCGQRGHASCACWVTLRPPLNTPEELLRLERELTEWIAHGCADSKASHQAKSMAIRESKGMRVRRR